MRSQSLLMPLTLAVFLATPALAAPGGGGDRDGDGIPDVRDRCPNTPEDRDGFQDQDGCPDPDNDQDRIPDASDKCPNHPETYNGFQDQDGCPDRRPKKVVIATRCPRIRIDVNFRRRSSKVDKTARAVLVEVVKVMRSNPKVKLLELQGHADDYRSVKADQRLSLRRAKAVRRYLIRKGVSPKRLAAKGYGRTVPYSKSRKASRRLNRRVTFKVLHQTKRGPRPRKRR